MTGEQLHALFKVVRLVDSAGLPPRKPAFWFLLCCEWAKGADMIGTRVGRLFVKALPLRWVVL